MTTATTTTAARIQGSLSTLGSKPALVVMSTL
jgi:hypothetical protein